MLKSESGVPGSTEFRELISNFSSSITATQTAAERFRKVELFTRYLLDPKALACKNKAELMAHLTKFVMQSPKYGFTRVLSASNARLTENEDTVTLTVGEHVISLPEDAASSAKKLMEVAFCAVIRKHDGPDYLVSYDTDARTKEINDLDPFGTEEKQPSESYGKYVKVLKSGPPEQDIVYETTLVDELRNEKTLLIEKLPPGTHIALNGVEKDDMRLIAHLASEEDKVVKVLTNERSFYSRSLIKGLKPVPFVLEGLDIIINQKPRNDLGDLVSGPEDEAALDSLVAEFTKLLKEGTLTIDMGKVREIASTPDEAPRSVFSTKDKAPTTKNYTRPDPKGAACKPDTDITEDMAAGLRKLMEAGQQGAPKAMEEMGLAPAKMDPLKRREIYGDLLNSKDEIPKAMKADLRKVFETYQDTVCYQEMVGHLADAVAKSCQRINQLSEFPHPLAVAMLYFGRSPGVFGYGTDYIEDDQGNFWPKRR